MRRTKDEKYLLKKLASGAFDGPIGRDLLTAGGSLLWTLIRDGVPIRYKQGPSKRFFNGKENERIPGKKVIHEKWDTDERKLEFFKTLGFLIDDAVAQNYYEKHKSTKR